MSKHKNIPAVTEAARDASKQMAAWGAVETLAKKAVKQREDAENSTDFAEFLLSGKGSKAIVRIGDSVFRIEA